MFKTFFLPVVVVVAVEFDSFEGLRHSIPGLESEGNFLPASCCCCC